MLHVRIYRKATLDTDGRTGKQRLIVEHRSGHWPYTGATIETKDALRGSQQACGGQTDLQWWATDSKAQPNGPATVMPAESPALSEIE